MNKSQIKNEVSLKLLSHKMDDFGNDFQYAEEEQFKYCQDDFGDLLKFKVKIIDNFGNQKMKHKFIHPNFSAMYEFYNDFNESF